MRNSRSLALRTLLVVVAASASMCAGAVHPMRAPHAVSMSALWEQPDDLSARDLFWGPWGQTHAPDANAEYAFEKPKSGGTNPGVVVRDPQGRVWHVKQSPNSSRGNEGPVEVVLSRVLSAVGYHQPPVYFLSSFKMRTDSGVRDEPGGRFRFNDASMKDVGEWSWQQNPFVGQRPYQGLLAIMLLFNSTDLKNSNNTLYEVAGTSGTKRWYVVRDLGAALGETGRIGPKRGYPDLFARDAYITGAHDGLVEFDYHGRHAELVHDRITTDDVRWACDLLAGLSDAQWQDAFRAGGYTQDVAARFISSLHARIAKGQQLGGRSSPASALTRTDQPQTSSSSRVRRIAVSK